MAILPSHRQGIYLLEHCRVMVKVDFLPSLKEGDSSFIENGTTTPQCYRR